ncbi:MAG: transport system ATP-binding/permease protein, partial [Actinoplanes sp.]|nr:transport system ATP-binding/permease protein [Actinoplanes sp.]
LRHLPGGIDEYLSRVADPVVVPTAPQGSAPAPAMSGLSAAELRVARKDLSRLERQLGKLDERVLKINESLAAHGSDYDKLVELDAQLKAVQQERGEVEEAWLELAERVPEA